MTDQEIELARQQEKDEVYAQYPKGSNERQRAMASLNTKYSRLRKEEEKKRTERRKEIQAAKRDIQALQIEQPTLEELKGLSKEETLIISTFCNNVKASNSEIADNAGVSTQLVTVVLAKDRVNDLINKLLSRFGSRQARTRLLQGVKEQDMEAIQIASKLGFLSDGKAGSCERCEGIQVNKPIEDPDLEKMLKELGDKLADVQIERSKAAQI